jgi:two-component system response regulator AlgR
MKPSPKLDILIVDDEPLARSRIKSLCKRMTGINHVKMASGGREALDLVAQDCPQIMLLDIDMPDLSGMEVAKLCKEFADAPEIIFTTAHDRYAIDAFRLNATDYLLKPVKEELLREAVERVLEKRKMTASGPSKTGDHWLWVQDGEGAVQIRSADIGWIAADRDYMRLCMSDRNYLVHEAMQSLLQRLPGGLFIRIHRSAAVNRSFVRDIRRKGRRRFIVMKDGTELTIGPSFVKAAMSALAH